MPEIETGVSTLKGLAEWILKQPIEFQERPIGTCDPEMGHEPWHGVIEDNGPFAGVVFSDSWTKAQHAVYQAQQRAAVEQRSHEHWNRPEVLDAKKKGLLP